MNFPAATVMASLVLALNDVAALGSVVRRAVLNSEMVLAIIKVKALPSFIHNLYVVHIT